MMQPIGGDNPEVTSALITRQREPFALRHPRFFASVWFGILGALSSGIVGLIVSSTSEHLAILAGGLGSLGCLSAMAAGATLGDAVLGKKGISGKGAVGQAAVVVLMSHVCIGVLPSLITFIVAMCGAPGGLSNAVTLLLLLPLITFVIGGIVTFPLGCFGGWLLFKYRERIEGPRGCKLHGYREQ
jgi:hypothetical protein